MPAKIHGLLASANVTAIGSVSVYTVPTGRKATITLNIANDSNIANTYSATLAGAVIEAGVSLPAAGVLERNGITMAAGQAIAVSRPSASDGTLRCAVWGIEEDA